MKKLNWDKELKKVQKRGLYNPKVRVFSIIAIAVLTLGIGLTFSVFSYSSGDVQAFNSQVKKKVSVTINAINGSADSGVKQGSYNNELDVTVTPNSGYRFDSVSCTNEQSAIYDNASQQLKITPTQDTVCTIEFKESLHDKIIASNNIVDYDTIEPKQWINDQPVSIDAKDGICVTKSWSNFDLENFSFSNYVCDITNPADYIGWFTFGFNDYIMGNEIYSITNVSGTTITLADVYNLHLKIYDGIVAVEDENGISYVNRGNITNNYVSFANKIWRIVRVNGDGTIRIIIEGGTGTTTTFNSSYSEHKHVGYTYDNSHACTKANPCTTQDGTASTIKSYLENWYSANLSDYDEKVALSSYCNDTTSTLNGTNKIYKATDRVTGSNPSLKCNDTSEVYGGYYKLKIGLLSADEMLIVGLPYYGYAGDSNYLYFNNEWWSLTPGESTGSSYGLMYAGYKNGMSDLWTTYNLYVRPVINLKADTTVTSGNGTKENPYVIG